MASWMLMLLLGTLMACGEDDAGTGTTVDGTIDDGGTSITGQNQRPVADAGEDQTLNLGQRLTLDGSRSTDDGQVVAWNWDLGDGRQTSGESIEHTYSAVGVYTVTLTVIDDSGLQDDDVLIVRVDQPNMPPRATIVADLTAIEGEPFEVTALGSQDDTGITQYGWRFGDEATDDEVTFGDVDDNGRASHVYGMWGEYTLSLEVTDGGGLTDTAQHEVLVLAPPRAVMDGPRNTTVDTVIMLTAEDSFDPDGNIVDYQWTLHTDNSTTTLGSGPILE
ncbi:MAG: PKD domain-containing protein, partial [Myxococcota bacterium]